MILHVTSPECILHLHAYLTEVFICRGTVGLSWTQTKHAVDGEQKARRRIHGKGIWSSSQKEHLAEPVGGAHLDT